MWRDLRSARSRGVSHDLRCSRWLSPLPVLLVGATYCSIICSGIFRLDVPTFCAAFTAHGPPRVRTARAAKGDGGLNVEKLRDEGTFAEGLVQSFGNLFNPEAAKKAEEAKKAAKQRAVRMKALQKELKMLQLAVVANEDSTGKPVRRKAPVGILQQRAKQNICFYAATKEEALVDVLLALRLSARDLAQKNLLIVPVLLDVEIGRMRKLPPKLAKNKALDQGFVALPRASDEEDEELWGDIFTEEFQEAASSGMGEQAEAQGIALVVSRTGDIVLRGVGRPNWDMVFSELGI